MMVSWLAQELSIDLVGIRPHIIVGGFFISSIVGDRFHPLGRSPEREDPAPILAGT